MYNIADQLLGHSPQQILSDDTGSCITVNNLIAFSRQPLKAVSAGSLIFFPIRNTVADVSLLFQLLACGAIVALTDPDRELRISDLALNSYKPNFVVERDNGTLGLIELPNERRPLSPTTALLLSTSGSTGSPKFVKLSHRNLIENARSIVSALAMSSDDCALGHLPLHYSFGLSILTSSLSAGASIHLTEQSIVSREFWKTIEDHRISHFPGVPYHYSTMLKLGLGRLKLGSVKTMIQAGGHLDLESREILWRHMDNHGGRFCVMYGQTEASPRICVLPHDEFRSAPSSVGRAIPGTEIRIVDDDEQEVPRGVVGRVIVIGPNVMEGYASSQIDLANGDTQGGRLDTGDLGFIDDFNRLTLTGRRGRMVKIVGLRVNLDEIERQLLSICVCCVTSNGDRLAIFIEEPGYERAINDWIASETTIPIVCVHVLTIPRLPRTDRGKIDYEALKQWL